MEFSTFFSSVRFRLYLPLSRFKTEICRNYKEKGSCLYADLCQFAHGKHELRVSFVSNLLMVVISNISSAGKFTWRKEIRFY